MRGREGRGTDRIGSRPEDLVSLAGVACSTDPVPLYRALPDPDLEGVSRSLSDSEEGLTEPEVTELLRRSRIDDTFAGGTRRYRLLEALRAAQSADLCANRVYAFLEATFAPDSVVTGAERRELLRSLVNRALVPAGFEIDREGHLGPQDVGPEPRGTKDPVR